ncbi:MAG: FAD-dependent oxidoreductase, partial [Proteobacteria bacterium]|nr:FAD-dependent oxidoreductase [Pseudomonadota bacterium]
LGGQVVIAARAPSRDEFANCVRHLAAQVERLGVAVHLGVEVTPEKVTALKPDVVVIATGSVPLLPDLPGADRANVFTPWQVLTGEAELGERVVVVDGGDNDAKFCSVADFLAERGKRVEMITHLPSVGQFVENFNKFPILQKLRSNGVIFTPFTLLTRIGDGFIVVSDPFTGETREIEADSVVLAWYNRADNALYRALQGKVEALHAIGDCVAPRRVLDAVREGFLLGRQL